MFLSRLGNKDLFSLRLVENFDGVAVDTHDESRWDLSDLSQQVDNILPTDFMSSGMCLNLRVLLFFIWLGVNYA